MKIAGLILTVKRLGAEFLGLPAQQRHAAASAPSIPGSDWPSTHSLPEQPAPGTSAPALSSTASRCTVRVIRVSEPGLPRQCAGRMVMSGRFADVCAELDRLAA